MQTRLEKTGMSKRNELLVQNDYDRQDKYSATHEDALSHPESHDKPLGKVLVMVDTHIQYQMDYFPQHLIIIQTLIQQVVVVLMISMEEMVKVVENFYKQLTYMGQIIDMVLI